MNQEELLTKIDPFLWKLLPESEREIVEKEMRDNADFRTEVAKRQLENDAIKQMRQNALRAKMTVWREESELETLDNQSDSIAESKATPVVQLTPLRVVKFTPMHWAAAAAVALLVVVGGNYWATNTYGNAALVADFYPKSGDLLRGDDAFGGGNDNDPALYEAGNKAFGTPNYAEAIDNYSKLTQPEYVAAARMPFAEAHFQLKNYDKAIAIYKDVLDDKQSETPTFEQAEWKLAVTYLAANKTDADTLFNNLLTRMTSNPSHAFHQPAVDLSQKVNSFWWRWVN